MGVHNDSRVGVANLLGLEQQRESSITSGAHTGRASGSHWLARLPKSGADRDGDPLGAGYGVRSECKFDLANQKNDERPVAENQGHVRPPPPEQPRTVGDHFRRAGRVRGGHPTTLTHPVGLYPVITRQGERKGKEGTHGALLG